MLSKRPVSSGRRADPWTCGVPDETIPYDVVRSGHQKHASSVGESEPSQTHSDQDLVRLAQRDDTVAVDELIRRYQKKVYHIAYNMAYGEAEEARDLAQEVFFRVFKNIKKFDGRSSFYTWLFRIVVNTCLGQRRRNRRWAKIIFLGRSKSMKETQTPNELENRPALDDESNPAAVYDGRQLRGDVRKVLDSLPDKQRMVFQLKVLQEMTIPEIAGVTGMAEGTIKTHLFRATRRARDRLHKWMEE